MICYHFIYKIKCTSCFTCSLEFILSSGGGSYALSPSGCLSTKVIKFGSPLHLGVSVVPWDSIKCFHTYLLPSGSEQHVLQVLLFDSI